VPATLAKSCAPADATPITAGDDSASRGPAARGYRARAVHRARRLGARCRAVPGHLARGHRPYLCGRPLGPSAKPEGRHDPHEPASGDLSGRAGLCLPTSLPALGLQTPRRRRRRPRGDEPSRICELGSDPERVSHDQLHAHAGSVDVGQGFSSPRGRALDASAARRLRCWCPTIRPTSRTAPRRGARELAPRSGSGEQMVGTFRRGAPSAGRRRAISAGSRFEAGGLLPSCRAPGPVQETRGRRGRRTQGGCEAGRRRRRPGPQVARHTCGSGSRDARGSER